jgi:hypothetical protein
MVQYIRVSSAVFARVERDVLLGQLHRFSRIITDKAILYEKLHFVYANCVCAASCSPSCCKCCSVFGGAIGTCMLIAVVMLCILPLKLCVNGDV